MNRVLKIYEDEDYLITISKDGYKVFLVQVLVMTAVRTINTTQGSVEERAPQLAWSKSVDMVKYDPKGNVIPVDANEFRKDAIKAVQEAKAQLGQLQHVQSMYDGVVKDFESQLNVQGKQTP